LGLVLYRTAGRRLLFGQETDTLGSYFNASLAAFYDDVRVAGWMALSYVGYVLSHTGGHDDMTTNN
jgi:hypothetical protein